ncbi:RES family NAD+ phosphorylase [Bifidobacterium stellenboschense]|uniref:RES domain-containing protein n=1 Tax=Bifidobacterium stellenboschense TaxID=762211 RepID=A0A087E0N8_9BIFI|nr:RES family NAD+ phosphorylase [Bifidobacterium stellenboschense]KFJ01339.1 RES domain-containing protein [Bifidobacterium stellenboschense]
MTNCCVNCFQDHVLRDLVESFDVRGNCDFCDGRGVCVYDFRKHADLQNMLLSIIGLYDTASSETESQAHSLAYELTSRWHLLKLSESRARHLLNSMYQETTGGIFDGYKMEKFLGGLVQLKRMRKDGKEHDWEKFADHLKYHNRFFVSFIDLEALEELITYTRATCKPGTILTRARIAKDAKGFAPGEDMGAPPRGLAGNGRINPAGISELYTTLGNDAEADDTALHEIRAGMHDYVTFGKFVLNRAITIADLSRLEEISPFDIDEEDLPLLAANLEILNGMSREISKPMRRGDDSLEYVPSQYIAEFIKSLQYDGVKYASTLRNGGMNLCLFDPTAYVCCKTYTKRVSEVAYSTVN